MQVDPSSAGIDQVVARVLHWLGWADPDQGSVSAWKNGPNSSVTRPVAFIIMPFRPEDLQVVYKEYVKPTVERLFGFDCIRGDDIAGPEAVMEDVLYAIRRAKVVIADLTGQNPNVCYEVGIAHEHGTPTLLLTQSLEDVPFDLRHRRILEYEYTPPGCKRLERQLEEHLRQILGLERPLNSSGT